jgi:hypothetical protein
MEGVNGPRSARRPLAIVKSLRPLSEMSDEELKAFTDGIFDSITPDRLLGEHSESDPLGEDVAGIAGRSGPELTQHSPRNVADAAETTDNERITRIQRVAEPDDGV